MKKQILAAVILSSLSAATFALPQTDPQPLLGEVKATRLEGFRGVNPLAESGAERLQERFAESGADRLQQRFAEGGADRLQDRFAEGGAKRLQDRFAEGGAERTLNQRIG